MSLWEKLCPSRNTKSNSRQVHSPQPDSAASQNSARDIFVDTRFLLKDRQVRTIFDVGANRGDFTAEFAQAYPDAEIHCFEPSPKTYEMIKNRFNESSLIKLHNLAVSNNIGTADFCCNKECATDSLLKPAADWKEWIDGKSDGLLLTSCVQVKTITLDRFCYDHGISEIDILKIDTQGAERLILEGTSELLQKKAFRVIIIELLFVPVYSGQPYYYEICSRLAEYGYTLINFYDRRYDDYLGLQLKWTDGIFINRGMYEY